MAYTGTNAVLAANGEYVSPTMVTDRADSISGMVFSDQGGTIFIEQSFDPLAVTSPTSAKWDLSTSYAVTANTGRGFSEALYGPYVRVRYVNGATGQTAFRLFSRFTSAGEAT